MTTAKQKKLSVASATLKTEGYIILEPNRCICIKHDKKKNNILSTSNFYESTDGSVYENSLHGKIPICRSCLEAMFHGYFAISQNAKWSVYKMCQKLDISFINSVYEGTVKEGSNSWQRQFGLYIKTFNSFKKTNSWGSFDQSEEVDFDFHMDGSFKIKKHESKWSDKDKKVRTNVIDLIGYDPYEGYADNDQRFLYNDIVGYLDDETLDDQYKVSAIIQIVDNNNQIRKYQFVKNQYSSDYNMIIENSDKLASLENLIKKIVESNDKIAKENGISVKGRKEKSLNKSSLTGKMKYLHEQKFDDLEIDFYNQMTCFGMERAIKISNRAIRDQFPFDENTFNEIIITQRELIQEKDKKVLDLEEELRKLNIKLDSNYEVIVGDDYVES